MRKLYLILDKRGNFEAHGNASKSAWRSLYWVHYHIGRYSNLNDYRIMSLYSDGKFFNQTTLTEIRGKVTKLVNNKYEVLA